MDDLTVACSSPGALRAIASSEPESACSRYAFRTRARFNYTSGKTAALAMCGSAPPGDVGCPVVSQKAILGVLFDDALSFAPLLKATIARGHSLFESVLFSGETGGFALPVLCAMVPARVESAIL